MYSPTAPRGHLLSLSPSPTIPIPKPSQEGCANPAEGCLDVDVPGVSRDRLLEPPRGLGDAPRQVEPEVRGKSRNLLGVGVGVDLGLGWEE